MKCPNYIICNGKGNNYNGVCYNCDNINFGYFSKLQDLRRGIYPNVYFDTYSNYQLNKLDKEQQQKLLLELEKNRLTTGILKTEEINKECSICLENNSLYIKHPTCNLHSICVSCFKKTFIDYYEYNPPIPPDCYNTFSSWMDENKIDTITDEILCDNNYEHYNCYCDKPNNNWPENIKKIYSICSEYDRKDFEYLIKQDKKEETSNNIRSCPECRAFKLTI